MEDSKIIDTEKFIYQVGPKHEKQIVATGIPFGLQVPYEHKKFLRKQEKLKYAAMYPKIVEAPWQVMFPSGQLFDKLYSPQPEYNWAWLSELNSLMTEIILWRAFQKSREQSKSLVQVWFREPIAILSKVILSSGTGVILNTFDWFFPQNENCPIINEACSGW